MQENTLFLSVFFCYCLRLKIKNDTFAPLFQAQREDLFRVMVN